MKNTIIMTMAATFDSKAGSCQTEIDFKYRDHPNIPVLEEIIALVVKEAHLQLTALMDAETQKKFITGTEDPRKQVGRNSRPG